MSMRLVTQRDDTRAVPAQLRREDLRSHEVWRSADGTLLTIVGGGKDNREVRPGMLVTSEGSAPPEPVSSVGVVAV